MKRITLILWLLLSTTVWTFASDFKVGDLYYNITSDSTVEVTYQKSNSSDNYAGLTSVIIPSTVTYGSITYTVTSIGRSAFYHCTRLTSVSISNSVKVIGYQAFYGCSGLTSITIPNSVTSINSEAFYDCMALTSITIPNSVTYIGEFAIHNTPWYKNQPDGVFYINNVLYTYRGTMPENASIAVKEGTVSISPSAFYGRTRLTSITIPNSVTNIGYRAFYQCKGLTSITIPNSVTNIGSRAFYECTGLTSITIPSSDVMSIGDYAFSNCTGLASATIIGDSVVSIRTSSFSGCTGLTSIVWNVKSCKDYSSSDEPFNAIRFQITSFTFGEEVESIPACLCYGMIGLTSVTIPNSVTSIGDRAFYQCAGLTSVTISNSVTSIGDRAFYQCAGLTSVTISNSVTNIGSRAFYGCSGLTSITIPNSVTSIGNSAFNGCSGLTSVTIPNSVTNIGSSAFSDCTGLTSVIWNAKSCEDFSSSSYAPFSATDSLITSFTFGDDVEYVPSNLCYGMTGLTSVTIGKSVTSIGKYAFRGCTGLTSVMWNAKLCEDFGYYYRPFSDTDSLITSFTFGDEVEYIPACLCYGMKSLTSVAISNSVTSIGERAFLGCTGLTSVTIGNSVTSIGNYAFRGCTGLTSVTIIGNSVTSISSDAFEGCTGLTSIVWNAKSCNDFSSSSYAPFYAICSQITSFTFGDEVERIPAYLCYGMTGLTSITIPDSVTSIRYDAFNGCSGLTSVTIGKGVMKIGDRAFNGCTGLTSVVWNAKSCKDFSSSYAPFYDSRSQITSFTLGDDVESIPAYLCYGMESLTSITIPNSVMSIGKDAFWKCSGLTSVTIGNSVTSIGDWAFSGCSGLTSITIPNSVTSIKERTFYGCAGLTSVIIPNSVTSIGQYAFSDCSGLASVTIGDSVTSIGDYAFRDCTSLTSVVWNAKSCTSFGNQYDAPFYYSNSQITSFVFSDEVEYIPSYLCYGMSGLTSVTIPNSVTSIGGYAFCDCSDLASVTMLSETPATIKNGAVFGYNYSLPIYVPCGTMQAYREAWSLYSNFLEPATQYSFTALPESGEMGKIYFEQAYSCSNDTVIMYASSYIGYSFTQWHDGNTDNPRTVKVTSDTIFVAHYSIEQYTIYTEVNDAERGSVSQPDTADYLSYVTIYATANYGYHFTQWHDGNTDNPRIVQVEGHATYTAYFERNTYAVTVLSANELQGTVTANATQAEYQDTVTLTATPSIGYRFAEWNDGNTDNPRQVVLACDTTITAEFALAYSGQCGDNLYWAYAGHTLTISGTGAMYDYNADNMPWLLLRDTINAVVLERGITHIGNNAFNGLAKLNKIELPNTLTSIGTGAFAGCRKLYDIYSYAVEPPVADNTSFSNYNVYLLVPCDNLRDYQMDAVFGSFKYIQCLGAENTTTDGDVTVTPSDNEAVFVWPSDASAATYTLEIRKDRDVFCTLHFNAAGQLTSIAFAPSRNGKPHRAAEQTGAGFRFTVTGLSQSTRYQFDMTVKDATDTTLQTYTGEFNTTGVATSVGQAEDTQSATVQKVLRNGQVYILRGDKTYTVTGQEVND